MTIMVHVIMYNLNFFRPLNVLVLNAAVFGLPLLSDRGWV